ncbi:MAG: hypothetical protein ACKVQB_12380 [Bacteroidia bacterium]
MKKILTSLLILLTVISASAQKTDKTKIDFEVEMLPLEIISKEKKFDITIQYDYAAKVEAALAEVQANKDAAAKEKEEYEKKSLGEKMARKALLGETKPSGNFSNQAFIPTLFPEEGIKGSINIPGYTKTTGAKGNINVMFFEMSFSLDATQTKITYYPLKVVLTATNDKGELVFQGDLPGNNTSTTYTATTGLGSTYLSTLKGLETDAKNQAIKNLNAYLKKMYGFNILKDERGFYDVKDKKQTYPEYHEAFEKVKMAFIYCNMPGKQAEMAVKLKEAIVIWETALKEYDKSNKEGRITTDIAAATYLNIAEACIWTKEFDKSIEALAMYKMTGEDYSRAYSNKTDFMKDYSARYNKYTTY